MYGLRRPSGWKSSFSKDLGRKKHACQRRRASKTKTRLASPPVELHEVSREDLEIAVHDRAEPADHHGGHGVPRVGVREAERVGVPHGEVIVHHVHPAPGIDALLVLVLEGLGLLGHVLHLAPTPSVGHVLGRRDVLVLLEELDDVPALHQVARVVVHETDHVDGRAGVAGVREGPEVADDAGVRRVGHALHDGLGVPVSWSSVSRATIARKKGERRGWGWIYHGRPTPTTSSSLWMQ